MGAPGVYGKAPPCKCYKIRYSQSSLAAHRLTHQPQVEMRGLLELDEVANDRVLQVGARRGGAGGGGDARRGS